MATAKMKIILPLVVWISILTNYVHAHGGIGFGIRKEIFFLNLEDGYFGCQVNESTDVLQLYEISRICDGTPDCYRGSDELRRELKCTNDCHKKDGLRCQNGACLDSQCHCNDGYGGCSCEVPDENECKNRPCDVFAHCTNTLGSFHCTCFPGYQGDGFYCQDIDECKDPSIAARCVENAECCNLPAHFVCKCLPGFEGDGEIECRDINECAQPNVCGHNAVCHNVPGNYTCQCLEGYHGNPFLGCEDVDECSYEGACGPGALCSNVPGGHTCACPPGYDGDPLVHGCVDVNECARNPCGQNAYCSNLPGSFKCECPPGSIGDPLKSCTALGCVTNDECSHQQSCINGACQNPCHVTNPCSPHHTCQVDHHNPVCVKVCECQHSSNCQPGYRCDGCACVADSIVEPTCNCGPGIPCDPITGACLGPTKAPTEQPGCKSDDECPNTDTCLNRQCVNTCAVTNPCAANALCEATNHRANCKCPPGLVGNAFVNCYRETVASPECTADSECASHLACVNQRCQNPCVVADPCGLNAECAVNNHRAVCNCPNGWAGNPQVQCYKPECKVDSDCLYDKACVGGSCVSPCLALSCGRGAECKVTSPHRATCVCPAGTQGNPLLSCVSVVCQYNEDCADHEACDRLNRVCRPVCESDTCAETAVCTAKNHQPTCTCPAGTQGNAYIACEREDEIRRPIKAECETDADCPSRMACINDRCADPCRVAAMCSPDQECRVQDTLPLRTVYCQCPPDTVPDYNGRCKAIARPVPQCRVDLDCGDPDRCVRGSCVEACRVDPCGLNAICTSQSHTAVCSCPPGFVGNPHLECSFSPSYTPPVIVPECVRNDECPWDRSCVNQRCVNPCVTDPCARGSFCHVESHQPVCRCPAGFLGDPRIECRAPDAVTVGCSSNSDCSLKESCVNRLCISPCNCGPNAECRVTNHYAICFCRPGYSGNPQIGCTKLGCESDEQCSSDKMCYNGECINPCILGDPCAANAECYGENHRASCRCRPGYDGNPLVRCARIECRVDSDCPQDRSCVNQHCVNPCDNPMNPPCAANAVCYVRNHYAACRCPDHLPMGNPMAYCERRPPVAAEPECRQDPECPSQLACIRNICVNPCIALSPCATSSRCSVLDTMPVRTMICTCPDGWVPNNEGECRPVVVPIPPGCTADTDCPSNETCINRMCRNPCNCGTNTNCVVQNHRPICSCLDGFEGNPNIACKTVGCRSDSECGSGRACVNGICINPCTISDPCGINAECYPVGSRAECRCFSGYRGNPYERCFVVGCRSNSDCPDDRACINGQCINPCVYEHPCASQAECLVHNHLALCRCPSGMVGNPYTTCRPEVVSECRVDGDCPSVLACFNGKCKDPCGVLEPCSRPSICQATSSLPVRTMICVCPEGYISSGSGSCKPVQRIEVGGCSADSECPLDKACLRGLCRDPCRCGPNAECRVRDHKPVCSCLPGYDGNAELNCIKTECHSDSDCAGTHSCINRQCVPACAGDGSSCGTGAICYGVHHRAVCQCQPGLTGDANIACVTVGCRADSDCPSDRACINALCVSPCAESNPCQRPAECVVYDHKVDCSCPPGYVGDLGIGCEKVEVTCVSDSDCPSQTACINSECVNPCNATEPCGVNTRCQVFDTPVWRTMVCECLPGYQGNAAVRCDLVPQCAVDKGYVVDEAGNCVCPPGTALNNNDECVRCLEERGQRVDDRGRCVCALERGMIIDERGNCVCPTEFGYRLENGYCAPPPPSPECETNSDCPDYRFCNQETKKCEDPCLTKRCGINALCNATRHQAVCQCIYDYVGDPEVVCNTTSHLRTDFPRPDMVVSCLSDGVQVEIHITEKGFNGVLYVKGHSKDEQCRRVVTLPSDSPPRTEIFKVTFGTCGLIHVNGQASFVLVIQKHPKLVTYKAQAYHIKCVYSTGEQNVTLGFNVSMLTTAGTIANTGPPPTCSMRIVTHTGQEINSAEIGDNLMLQVDVQPSSIYGGFARSCVAKTMEDSVENEYIVTDENGCATEPSIFSEWDYNPETQSLLAGFNAFKFPSSDNIRFQCNIRVCFGKCQPVNCRGYNAFGKRRRREIDNNNNTSVEVAEAVNEGQLREEITIQSNAILTFERREERYVSPTEAPDIQEVEPICVSMIGFIIALIMTALLALVAVAVAVSCWLIAYRRRPKVTGPLPHPPEFPNPLFTTPEPVAEPSPDYLS